MFNAAFIIIDEEEREVEAVPRPRRVLRDRLDPLNVADTHLLRYYRFPRHVILELCELLNDHLVRPSARIDSLPVPTQILTTLRFYASGSFQHVLGDTCGLSQPSCSRVLTQVSERLTELAPNYIRFPLEDANFILTLKQGFYQMHGFPNVIGLIDGTLINIKAPSEDEHVYVDRYRSHSLNALIICDSNLRVLHLTARWPGSTHDQFIWSHTTLHQRLENDVIASGWLIGDSGFTLTKYLMTPVRNPVTQAENNYNTCLRQTRSANERCIGVLKSVFRAIDVSGGALQYSPIKCARIITSVCVLHNWRIDRRIPYDGQIHNAHHHENPAPMVNEHNPNAVRIRQQLIDNVFA